MTNHSTISKVSNYLYRIDPAQTSCKENEVHDEYDQVAIEVFKKFENVENKSLDNFIEVLKQELKDRFYPEIDLSGIDEYELSKCLF